MYTCLRSLRFTALTQNEKSTHLESLGKCPPFPTFLSPLSLLCQEELAHPSDGCDTLAAKGTTSSLNVWSQTLFFRKWVERVGKNWCFWIYMVDSLTGSRASRSA